MTMPSKSEWSVSELIKYPAQAEFRLGSDAGFYDFCIKNEAELQTKIIAELPNRSTADQASLCTVLSAIAPDFAEEHLITLLERVDVGDAGARVVLGALSNLQFNNAVKEMNAAVWSENARRKVDIKIAQAMERAAAAIFVVPMEEGESVSPSLQYWIAPKNMDEPRLFAAVRRHLDNSNADVERRAMAILFKLQLPEVLDAARSLLDNRGLKMDAAEFLAEKGDPSGWPAIRDYIENQSAWITPRWKIPVVALVKSAEPTLREEIITFAEKQLLLLLEVGDNKGDDPANYTDRALALMSILNAAPPDNLTDLLKQVAKSRLHRDVRKGARWSARFECVSSRFSLLHRMVTPSTKSASRNDDT